MGLTKLGGGEEWYGIGGLLALHRDEGGHPVPGG